MSAAVRNRDDADDTLNRHQPWLPLNQETGACVAQGWCVYLLLKSKSTQETFLYFENMPPPILAMKCPFFYGIMETGGRLENIFF